ncbi:MAG: hypothetical protein H6739_21625 [Alphaproteobacteria bacterium]|nr:hypothetical protein [Alphaproteobacteria bacterium]
MLLLMLRLLLPAASAGDDLRDHPVALVEVLDVDGERDAGRTAELSWLLEKDGFRMTPCTALLQARGSLRGALDTAGKASPGALTTDTSLIKNLELADCLPQDQALPATLVYVTAALTEDAARARERSVSLTFILIHYETIARDGMTLPYPVKMDQKQVTVRATADVQGEPAPWRSLLIQAVEALDLAEEEDRPVIVADPLTTPTLGQPVMISLVDSWRPSGGPVGVESVDVKQPLTWVGRRPVGVSDVCKAEPEDCRAIEVSEVTPATWSFTPMHAGTYLLTARGADGVALNERPLPIEVPAEPQVELDFIYRKGWAKLRNDTAAPLFPEETLQRYALRYRRVSGWWFPFLGDKEAKGEPYAESVVDWAFTTSAGALVSCGETEDARCVDVRVDPNVQVSGVIRYYHPLGRWDATFDLSPFAGEAVRTFGEVSSWTAYGYFGADLAAGLTDTAIAYRLRDGADVVPSRFQVKVVTGFMMTPRTLGERLHWSAGGFGWNVTWVGTLGMNLGVHF